MSTSIVTQVSLEEMMRSHEGLNRKVVADLKAFKCAFAYLPRVSDDDLALFLVNHEYDVKASLRNIDRYFLMRHHASELFAAREDVRGNAMKAFDTVFTVELLGRTENSQKVILARLLDTEPAHYDFADSVKALNMVLDTCVWVNGPDNRYILVLDLNGATMQHRHRLTWMGLKKFYEYMCSGSPIRLEAVHYVNSATAVDPEFVNFVKNAIVNNPDLVDPQMMKYHESVEALCQDAKFDRAILPNEMGGQAGSAKDLLGAQVKKLESHQAFLEDMPIRTMLLGVKNVPSALELFGPDREL